MTSNERNLYLRQAAVAYRVLKSAYDKRLIIYASFSNSEGHCGIMVDNQHALLRLFGHYDLRKAEDDDTFYAEVFEHGIRWYAFLHLDELTPEDCERLGIDYA